MDQGVLILYLYLKKVAEVNTTILKNSRKKILYIEYEFWVVLDEKEKKKPKMSNT